MTVEFLFRSFVVPPFRFPQLTTLPLPLFFTQFFFYFFQVHAKAGKADEAGEAMKAPKGPKVRT